MDDSLRKEVREKLIRHLDNSYIIISIGDLREFIPELNELINPKELNPGPTPKLIPPKKKKIVGDNEIIPLVELERRLIRAALEKTKGDVELAASEMGISERNLYRKLQTYGINHNDYNDK